MKTRKALFLFTLIYFFAIIRLQALDMSVSQTAFYGEKGSYVEVYFYVVGSSVQFDSLDSGMRQATVEITITFEQDGKIMNYDKFTLNSPLSKKISDFVAIKRFILSKGIYLRKVEALDLQQPDNNFSLSDEIKVKLEGTGVELSGIQLLSAFSNAEKENEFVKNGIFLESCAFNYYPQSYEELPFYLEVYNPDADIFKANYLRYAIYRKSGTEEDYLISEKYKKLHGQEVQAAILKMPIQDLPSGNYSLLVELRNQEKMLVDVEQVEFQRSNPSADLDIVADKDPTFQQSFARKLDAKTLRYTLKALAPLCKGVESNIVESLFFNDEIEPKQYFIHQYFTRLNQVEPEAAYREFMKVAEAVDNTFRSNVGYGFETDRGKIFMKYGRPTDLVHVEDEPSAPPYEIWFYDQLEEAKQYNVKFVFYNPSLATNDYILLHSNCRGERNNPRWEVELYDNAPNQQEGQNAASTRMQENYRRNARKIWEEL